MNPLPHGLNSPHAENSQEAQANLPAPYTRRMTAAAGWQISGVLPSQVAEAAAARWTSGGQSPELLAPHVVYLPELRLVELVFEDSRRAEHERRLIASIRKTGTDVSVILPISELASGHDELWGTGLTLQGWLLRDDGTIGFTGPEVA